MLKKFEGMPPQEGGEGEEQEIVITPYTWRQGERPRGYQETTSILRVAAGAGLNLRDLFSKNFLSRRETLILKAGTEGLTQSEADEMVKISKEINQKLTEALDAARRKK